MKVYATDKDGNFLNEHDCQPCPVTGGWLYPSHYSEVKPPEGEFESVKFIVDKWVTENIKTLKENIDAGIIELLDTEKYDDELKQIRMKNLDELLTDEVITKEAWYDAKLSECINNRRLAYQTESDPLKNECEYDGIDLKVWRDKVAEIKAKFPKPVKK